MTIVPWLRLLRLPNLLTVPGDVLAGGLLAHIACPEATSVQPASRLAAIATVLALYGFGLIMNDLVDRSVDAIERPERPLPSGAITPCHATLAAVVALVAGLAAAAVAGSATLAVAATLAACIMAYNTIKAHAVFGVTLMGACRALSVLLGAVTTAPSIFAVPPTLATVPLALGVFAIGAYTLAFSIVARHEVDTEKSMSVTRWLPFVVLCIILPVASGVVTTLQPPVKGSPLPAAILFILVITLAYAWLLGGILYRLQPVPRTIGGHVCNLMRIQAFFCLLAGGIAPAVILFTAALIFPKLTRRLPAS